MKYIKLFEELNFKNLKWYNNKILIGLERYIDFKHINSIIDGKLKINIKIILYKSNKVNIIKFLKKWKEKLQKELVILSYDLNKTSLNIVYKELYNGIIKPRRFIYHSSSPVNRDNILNYGLKPMDSSNNWNKHIELEYPPSIFAFNNTEDAEEHWSEENDLWQIDTLNLKNIWYKDLNIPSKYKIMTFDGISSDYLHLINKISDIV